MLKRNPKKLELCFRVYDYLLPSRACITLNGRNAEIIYDLLSPRRTKAMSKFVNSFIRCVNFIQCFYYYFRCFSFSPVFIIML